MAYFVLLYIGLGFMLLQLFVKQKKLEHIFFAIFCGSMAMVAAQQISAETLGPYQYLFGVGACATCNGMWLVSKSLFSGENSITKKHIVFAVLIALLIIINNGIQMTYELMSIEPKTSSWMINTLGEIINLFSSTVLVLTCWEALNGINKQSKQEFWLRLLFITSFTVGFLLCTVVAKSFFGPDIQSDVFPWLVCISALQIMLVTQTIIWLNPHKSNARKKLTNENELADIDESLISGIHSLVNENKKYLTHNLKMVDLANELNVSEYKISQAIRFHFEAPNFNHFINSFRIEHAKNLLELQETLHWSILDVALESGFASLATFNRVFKMQLGYSPKEHRKNLLDISV